MPKSHAKILLKIIDYWKLCYDEKHEEWSLKFREVNNALLIRWMIKEVTIRPGVIMEDEGYSSDHFASDESDL